MADVTMILKADNTQYVSKIKEAQQATQKLSDTSEQTTKRRMGLIELEEKRIKTLTELRRKSYTETNIEFYNKQLEIARSNVDKLEKAGIKSNELVSKSTDGVIDKIGRMAIAYLTVQTAVKVLQETVLSFFTKSQEGIELLERKMSGLKAAVGVLQGEFIKLGKAIIGDQSAETTTWGDRVVKALRLIATTANLIPGVRKYFDSLAKSMNEAGAAAENYTKNLQDLEDAERALIVPRAKASAEIIKARLVYADNTKTLEERTKALEKAIALENKTAEEEIKHQQWRTLVIRDYNAELEKRGQLRDEDRLRLEESIAKEIELETESNQRRIRATNSLMTLKKEAYQKNIDEIKAAQDKFNEYWDKADEEEKKRIEDKWQWEVDLAYAKYEELQKIAKDAYDQILKDEAEAKKKSEELERATAEAKRAILQETVNFTLMTTDLLSVLNQNQLQKELAGVDAKTQRLIENAQTYKLGKEAEALIYENAEAEKLKIEKKYRNQQKAIAISQAIIDTTLAVIRALKDYPFPYSLIVGGIMAAQGAMKIAIIKSQKFAKGGWTGDGGDKDETGERVAGVVHEKEFVVKKGQASKYRDVLEAINKDDRAAVYNSFTKIQPELVGGNTVNNVTVENNGPNNRLDRINNQLYQLNRAMSPKKAQKEEIMISGSMTVIRKGQNVRTVKR